MVKSYNLFYLVLLFINFSDILKEYNLLIEYPQLYHKLIAKENQISKKDKKELQIKSLLKYSIVFFLAYFL